MQRLVVAAARLETEGEHAGPVRDRQPSDLLPILPQRQGAALRGHAVAEARLRDGPLDVVVHRAVRVGEADRLDPQPLLQIGLAAGDPEQEVSQQFRPVLGVGYLGMELDSDEKRTPGPFHPLHDAIRCYRETIRFEPGDVPAWHNLGNAYEELGNYRDAIDCFSRAITHDPDHYESFFGRGSCHDALQESRKALADYNRALAINREYADIWYAKADLLYSMGRVRESLLSYRMVT